MDVNYNEEFLEIGKTIHRVKIRLDELRAWKPLVAGSNPVAATWFLSYYVERYKLVGGLRLLRKLNTSCCSSRVFR